MSAVTVPPVALVAGAVGLGALLYVWSQKQPGQSMAGAAGQAAAEAVADASAGAVIGVGEVFGIPATNEDQCSIDLASGDLWAASFSCPAKRFFNEGVMGNNTAPQDPKTGSW